jgi:hypothetical protein
MKTQKRTVVQWLKSLFFKKKAQVVTPKVEITEEEVISDPFGQPIKAMESFTLNEMPELKLVNQEKVYDTKHKFNLNILGSEYPLTEKQLIFYNIVKEFQNDKDGISGFKISYEFIKKKHGYGDSELAKLPKWKFKISSHHKTMKYLLSSGIVYRISNGKFKAKV